MWRTSSACDGPIKPVTPNDGVPRWFQTEVQVPADSTRPCDGPTFDNELGSPVLDPLVPQGCNQTSTSNQCRTSY